MLCVFVSNFSIYVYPNKTFIVTRSLRRLWLPLAFPPVLLASYNNKNNHRRIDSFPLLPRCPFRSSNLRP